MATVLSFFITLIFFLSPLSFAGREIEISPANGLTLAQCLQRTLQNHPGLPPSQIEILAREGEIEQEKRPPNPELSIEAENLLGTGDYQSFEGTETTLSVSQFIETAGKRSKRVRAAELDKQLAQQELEILKAQTLYETAEAFTALLAAQERARLDEEFYRTAKQVRETIQANVEAGKDSPIEKIRAEVMEESTLLQWNRARQEQENARLLLSSRMGEEHPSFSQASGDLFAHPAIQDASAWLEQMERRPELNAAKTEIEKSQANFDLEKANAVPDVTIQGGMRYLSENDDGAFVLGVSVPLPLFNRNQGAIRAAKERIEKARAEQNALTFEYRSSILTRHQSLVQHQKQLEHLQNTLLPKTQKAFELVKEGYQQGKFPYLNVLDAQRSLIETQLEIIIAAEEVHRTYNELERLTAGYGARAKEQ